MRLRWVRMKVQRRLQRRAHRSSFNVLHLLAWYECNLLNLLKTPCVLEMLATQLATAKLRNYCAVRWLESWYAQIISSLVARDPMSLT